MESKPQQESPTDQAMASLRSYIASILSSKVIVDNEEAKALPTGKFDVSTVKNLIYQTNTLYNSL